MDELAKRVKVVKFSEDEYGVEVDEVIVERGFAEHEALACWEQIMSLNCDDFEEIFKRV